MQDKGTLKYQNPKLKVQTQ